MAGSDYIYPRESNRIMRDLVESYGGKIVDEVYVPMAASEQRLALNGHAAAVATCLLSEQERTSFARSEYFAV